MRQKEQIYWDDVIKRTTLYVLFMAQQDHATELVVIPTIGEGSPIRYKVEGAWYEWSLRNYKWSLRSSDILSGVVAKLAQLAVFPEGSFPKEGAIDVAFSGLRLQWRIRMTRPAGGAIIYLYPG